MQLFCGNMDQTNNILEKIKSWFVDKWKWITGLFVGLLALSLAFLRRDSFYKKNFENLKKSTDAERKVIEDAAKKASEETDKILQDADEAKEAVIKKNKKAADDLDKEKDEFLEESKNSDTLAEDIARELGVDFVKTE